MFLRAIVSREDKYWAISPFISDYPELFDAFDLLKIREFLLDNLTKYEFEDKLLEKYCFLASIWNTPSKIHAKLNIPWEIIPFRHGANVIYNG